MSSSGKGSPNLYLDTSILASVLQKEHSASEQLLNSIRKKGWDCFTSAFAAMELFDLSQDNQYVLNQLQNGIHIKKAYKSLDQRILSETNFSAIKESISSLIASKCPHLDFLQYGESTWGKALKIKSSCCISAPDVIHLATAMEAGCDLLVTLDNFFLKEAEKYIKTCLPEQVEKSLKEMGFKL
jgi:predicted nucleic acid-binding protein